jgi:hypothetical protein
MEEKMNMARGNFVRNQKSVWFPVDDSEPSLNLKHPFAGLESIYVDTLPRDVSVHVMPIGGRSQSRKDFAVSIQPANDKLERLIAQGLTEGGSSYGGDLGGAVCDFVQRCASRLMRYGKAVFEIVFLRDRDNQEIVGCDLFEIDVRTLTFETKNIVQLVPEKWAAERKVPTVIELDKRRLAIFSLPSGSPDLFAIKEALAQLGGAALVQMFEVAQGDNQLGYDTKEHIRAEHLAIAAATRSIGWSAGQNLYELFTEYYVLYRRLVFERFVITLRESILRTLNSALNTIAEECGATARLHISGLPTVDDVTRALKELAAGDRTFGSVLDDFSLL